MKDSLKDKKLKAAIETQLRRVFIDGLSQGTKAICGVVLEEIQDNTKSVEDRLSVIKVFCEKSLGLAESERMIAKRREVVSE